MSREDLNEKLRSKQGYLKKGAAYLAEKFNVSEETVKAVKAELRDELSEPDTSSEEFQDHLNSNGLTMDDVKSVKFWQSASGEQRYSVVTMNQWHQFRDIKKEFLDLVIQESPKVSEYTYEKFDDPTVVEISLPDIHYGKVTGEGPDKIEEHFMKAVIDLYGKVSNLNVERIILPIGNDGLNSEGYSKATTAGTPQTDYMGWRESFRGYWKLMDTAIMYLSQFAPVDVVVIQGNHDYERMFYIGDLLQARFEGNPNITVDNSLEERKYYQYGVNMILFFHGDKVKGDKIPLLMATEQPIMWSQTKFREAHLGHFHKEMLNEFMGTKVRFIPSICGNDEWHKNKGYIGTMRVGQVHIWSKTRGYEGNLQTNIVNYEL